MRQQRFGDLDVRLVGEQGPGPLLVLMHGYGAPATDLVDLAGLVSGGGPIRFAFPAAPLALRGLGRDARAWWPIDVARLQADYLAGRAMDLWRRDPPGLDVARGQVLDMLEQLLESTGTAPHHLLLGGFSQGGILACDVAFRSEVPLGGLVVLSGAPVAETIWTHTLPARRSLPVFQSHGTDDPLLPFEAGQRLHQLMKAAGLTVDFAQFRGGHGVPPNVLERLNLFLGRFAGSSP